jgi:hypothetical protein
MRVNYRAFGCTTSGDILENFVDRQTAPMRCNQDRMTRADVTLAEDGIKIAASAAAGAADAGAPGIGQFSCDTIESELARAVES